MDVISDSDDENDSANCQQLIRRRLNFPQKKPTAESFPKDGRARTHRKTNSLLMKYNIGSYALGGC